MKIILIINMLVAWLFPQPIPIKKEISYLDKSYMKKLIHTESRGKSWAVSYQGARGVFQIHISGLEYTNDLYRRKYTLRQMHTYRHAFVVYKRVMYWHKWILEKEGKYCIVTLTNSYNMGVNATLRGRFNDSYLRQIVPEEWKEFKKGKRFYKYRITDGLVYRELRNEKP